MTLRSDAHESCFRPAPPTRVLQRSQACAACGKVLAGWAKLDGRKGCICSDCLTRLYQRVSSQ